MPNFTLDNFRNAAMRKYAPVTVGLSDGTEVELRGLIRLSEKDREKVVDNFTLMGEMKSTDGIDDMSDSDKQLLADAMNEILLVLAPGLDGRRLVSEIGDNVLVLGEVIDTWMTESRLGGSRVLAELLDKYGEALVADFLREYNVDLRDLFDDENPLDPQYVLWLVLGLSVDSAYSAERRGGPQFRGWTPSTFAQVATANGIRGLQYSYILTHIDKKAKRPNPPEPYPIPTRETDRSKPVTPKPGSFAGIAASMMAAARRQKAGM
ncbi:tail assembly chaperone [Mycobacterium phage LittleCherry]|uniref:Tail assembly chaperone n=3 Tax=Caudoviricetes TaxID=2731619 RepID=A0A076YJK6_9CAUD|nr:tail assembly chaperone [Mycobacterium phage LittleCherry]YP_009208905.1 tail assembly chaperone [Mycobacterium phage Swirley]YP_009635781.1 tail assembly chaperone [Mycobacterium phage George]AXC33842.1 tail assembly chaperone [Mycobacterium phage Tarynearal]WNM66853.1 tail assembly chaperone [Mycobacterium phage Milcery]AEK32673.1 tail assembly chaperone [Mycobacterium phage George]AGT11904.1 tail assembly chaperone [Mycobacterium phage LittleCherry]AIK68886.1 tail assembly chaperone [M